MTDENGYYEILGLMAGDYSVSAVVEGYIDGEASGVSVIPDEKTEHNFGLVAN